MPQRIPPERLTSLVSDYRCHRTQFDLSKSLAYHISSAHMGLETYSSRLCQGYIAEEHYRGRVRARQDRMVGELPFVSPGALGIDYLRFAIDYWFLCAVRALRGFRGRILYLE